MISELTVLLLQALLGAGAAAGVVAKLRSRRARRATAQAPVGPTARPLVIEVPGLADMPAGTVELELTPDLCVWLAAARSAMLVRMPAGNQVLLAIEAEALWKDDEAPANAAPQAAGFRRASRVLASREFLTVKVSGSPRRSVQVSLQALEAAHRDRAPGERICFTAQGLLAPAAEAAPQRDRTIDTLQQALAWI